MELLGGSFFCCKKPFPEDNTAAFFGPGKIMEPSNSFFFEQLHFNVSLLVLAVFEDSFEFSRFFFQRNTTVYKKARMK